MKPFLKLVERAFKTWGFWVLLIIGVFVVIYPTLINPDSTEMIYNPHLIHDTHTLSTCERWQFIQGKSITTLTIETRDTLIFETRELSLIEYKMRIKLKTQ